MQFNDASLFTFAQQQTYVLNTQVYQTIYEDIVYRDLVPINTAYPEWAAGYTQLIGGMVGQAEWQSGYAKDVPHADVNLTSVSAPFDMYAIGYKWNIEELGVATYANYPLTANKANAARRGSEEFAQALTLYGSAAKGWTGLINNALVTPVAAGGLWSAATPTQIIAQLNALLLGPASSAGTPGATLSNTILLPPAAYRLIAGTYVGVDSPGDTILSLFLRTNLYTARTGQPITVREVPQLATAATVGVAGGGRAIAYRNSAEVVELPMPMPYRFLDVARSGPLQYEVPGISRVGQLDIKIPGAFRYLDGITAVPTP